MKTLKLILVTSLVPIATLASLAQDNNRDKQMNDVSCNTQSKSIVVPSGDGSKIMTDGMFLKGEWDDALSFAVADNFDLYLKVDSEILYIGLKSSKPMGECVCEIRATSNNKEVFLLHVSGGLGEGISGFPSTTKFNLNNNKYWEANFLKADSLKKVAWFAAGQPIDKYDEIYKKRDGIEFKIYKKKFSSNSIKFTIGWATIEIKDKKPNRIMGNYPTDANYQNSDNWVELILPNNKN